MKNWRGYKAAGWATWRVPVVGPGRNIPIQLLPSMMNAVNNGFRTPPIWLEPMLLVPPPPHLQPDKKPPRLVTLQERLKTIWLERHPTAKQVRMVAAEVGYEKYWHHPCANFVWRQARLMKQGYDQEEAYAICEEQDRRARDYRQIERMLAMEQLEEFGVKEIDTADMFAMPPIFEHKTPEAQLEEIIDLRKKRGIKAALDARELPKGVSFFELRKLVERRPDVAHFIDLRKLGALYAATGAPLPISSEDDEEEDENRPDQDSELLEEEEVARPMVSKPLEAEIDLNDPDLKQMMLDLDMHARGESALMPHLIKMGYLEDDEEEEGADETYLATLPHHKQAELVAYMEWLKANSPNYKVDKWRYFLAVYDMGKNQHAVPRHSPDPDEFDAKLQNLEYRLDHGLPIQSELEDFYQPGVTEEQIDDWLAQDDMAGDEYEGILDPVLEPRIIETAIDPNDLMPHVGECKEDNKDDEVDIAQLEKKFLTSRRDALDRLDKDKDEELLAADEDKDENEDEDEDDDVWPDARLLPDDEDISNYDPRFNPEDMIQIHDKKQEAALAAARGEIIRNSRPAVWDTLLALLEAGEMIPEVREGKNKTHRGRRKWTRATSTIFPEKRGPSLV